MTFQPFKIRFWNEINDKKAYHARRRWRTWDNDPHGDSSYDTGQSGTREGKLLAYKILSNIDKIVEIGAILMALNNKNMKILPIS